MKAHRHFVRTQTREYFIPKEKKKYPFLRIALASLLQIPEETLTELPIVSAAGCHSLRVENYTSITTYEDGKIILLCPRVSIIILGNHLKIVRLNRDEILIEGHIQNITYR